MADFCTIEDVEHLLQITVTDTDACARAITEATAAIRNYCNQYIEYVADDAHTFDVFSGAYNLVLPEMPVIAVSSVVEDGTLLTADDDYVLANHGQLVRVSARRWAWGPQKVAVTYTHGYAVIPDDVVAVCARAAGRVYQAGLLVVDTGGIPGVASRSLGDFSVAYASGAGGAGEGVLGVSGARMLLLSEKDILNRYRYRGA